MIRRILLILVGLGALAQGIAQLGRSASVEEQTGWLYQTFGDQGIGIGMIIMGSIFTLLGVLLTLRAVAKARTSQASSLPTSDHPG